MLAFPPIHPFMQIEEVFPAWERFAFSRDAKWSEEAAGNSNVHDAGRKVLKL